MMTGSPDARYLEDQECWHHGRRASLAAISAEQGDATAETRVADSDAAHAAQHVLLRQMNEWSLVKERAEKNICDLGRALGKKWGILCFVLLLVIFFMVGSQFTEAEKQFDVELHRAKLGRGAAPVNAINLYVYSGRPVKASRSLS